MHLKPGRWRDVPLESQTAALRPRHLLPPRQIGSYEHVKSIIA